MRRADDSLAYHVSKAAFGALVERALAELPEQFARFLDEVPVEIRRRPSKEMLRKLGLEDDELLLGLYTGQSLMNRSVDDMARMPNVIFIFQEDIELSSDSEADLVREIRTTVLHEIGHHFGMDEDDLDELGYG
jgi:predicted Zn-dependent protease with MMP-like domain